LERCGEVLGCLGWTPLLQQGVAEIGPAGEVRWIGCDGSLVQVVRCVDATCGEKKIAEVVEGSNMRRIDREQMVIARLGVGEASLDFELARLLEEEHDEIGRRNLRLL
jgi:hypothetical protein